MSDLQRAIDIQAAVEIMEGSAKNLLAISNDERLSMRTRAVNLTGYQATLISIEALREKMERENIVTCNWSLQGGPIRIDTTKQTMTIGGIEVQNEEWLFEAVREKVEREKGCHNCNGTDPADWRDCDWDYCPVCGKRMFQVDPADREEIKNGGQEMEKTELKPCGTCGGDVDTITWFSPREGENTYTCACHTCKWSTEAYTSEEAAIREANSRNAPWLE